MGFDRPMGAKHGAERNRKTWKEEREAEAAELGYSRQPYCVIVGGGQGGIALGARLRQLNVPTTPIRKRSSNQVSIRGPFLRSKRGPVCSPSMFVGA